MFETAEFRSGEAGAHVVVETMNRRRPGAATLVVQPGLDHSSDRFASKEAAYADEGGKADWQITASVIADWFTRIARP